MSEITFPQLKTWPVRILADDAGAALQTTSLPVGELAKL